MSGLTAILNAVQFVMVALTIGSAIALLYSAYLFIFNPLSRLQAGLSRVEKGDLAARVVPGADDEFGSLAKGFNRMAETLQGLYQNLEAKVREKTERLESQRARLEALYESAAFVARADTLEALAQGIARQVRRVARADASAVRWSDEANRKYMLLASDCLPQSVIDEEHCIPTGDCLVRPTPVGCDDTGDPDPSGTHAIASGSLRARGLRVRRRRARPPARAPGRRDQPLLPRLPDPWPTKTASCWRRSPATCPAPSRAFGQQPSSARPLSRRNAASSPESCTIPSPRAWRS